MILFQYALNNSCTHAAYIKHIYAWHGCTWSFEGFQTSLRSSWSDKICMRYTLISVVQYFDHISFKSYRIGLILGLFESPQKYACAHAAHNRRNYARHVRTRIFEGFQTSLRSAWSDTICMRYDQDTVSHWLGYILCKFYRIWLILGSFESPRKYGCAHAAHKCPIYARHAHMISFLCALKIKSCAPAAHKCPIYARHTHMISFLCALNIKSCAHAAHK